MSAAPRPPWDPDPRYVVEPELVDPRDVETQEEAGSAGRLFATLVAIALLFAIAYFIASWVAQESALRGAPDGATASPALVTGRQELPGAPAQTVAPQVEIAPAIEGARGWATYCAPTPDRCQRWGGDAHLGAVRSFSWGDDPYIVQVCAFGGGRTSCTHVTVVSYCACGDRHGIPTVIDLSPAAFVDIAGSLGPGVIRVEVSGPVSGHLPRTTLPPTDVEP